MFSAHETDRPNDFYRVTHKVGACQAFFEAKLDLQKADVKDFLLNGVMPRFTPYACVHTGNVKKAKCSFPSSL